MSGRGPPPRESLAPQLIIPRKKTLIRRGVRLLTRHPREPLHFSLPSVSYANTPAIIQIPSFHPLERYALQNLLWREGPLLEKKRNNGARVLELIKIPYRVEGSHLSNSFEPGWMEIVFSSLIDFETMDGSGFTRYADHCLWWRVAEAMRCQQCCSGRVDGTAGNVVVA